MSYRVTKSTTAYPLTFLLVLASDHVSAATGLTPTVTLSKNGGAFGSPSGAVTEIANGWYQVAGNATDSNTLGPLILHASVATADPTDVVFEVVAQDLSTATVPANTTQLAGQTVTAAAGVTFPSSVASPTNITAGTITTVTTVTTVTNQLTAAAIATGVWQDTTAGDFTVGSSIGKSLFTGNHAPGAASGLALVGSSMDISSINAVSTSSVTAVKAIQGLTTADTIVTVSGNVNGNVAGSVGSVTGAVGSVTGSVGSVTGAVGSVTGNVGGNVNGNVVGSVGSMAAGGISNASLTADTGLKPLITGTASAGGATSITLTGAVATDNYYTNDLVKLTGGTGAGQARFISAYVGATKVATVGAWAVAPDNTTTFAVLPFDAVAGASAPTVAQIATGVWQDLLSSSDFSTVGSVGALIKADLDTNIGSRMATYTQPTGFLAATFPNGTIANTGNITTVGTVSGAVGSVTAGVTVTTNTDKTGYSLTSAEETAIADAVLNRDMSIGTDSGSSTVRTPRQALRMLRNKVDTSVSPAVIYKEDDATASWKTSLVTSAAAIPIVTSDPV